MKIWITAGLIIIAGWITNMVWLVQTSQTPVSEFTYQSLVALIGIFLIPVGAAHGIIVWFI